MRKSRMDPRRLFQGTYIHIVQEGPELVAITNQTGVEYSRLNLKTKKATHWYARKICNRIYKSYPNSKTPLQICCLGSSMGAIPYELLHHYSTSTVTCVDLDHESLEILKNSILKEFGSRVTYTEMDAQVFARTLQPKSFDIIINDLFSEFISPPFANSPPFLRNVLRALTPKGLYFANTYTDASGGPHGAALTSLTIPFLHFSEYQTGPTNVIYEVKATQKTSQL